MSWLYHINRLSFIYLYENFFTLCTFLTSSLFTLNLLIPFKMIHHYCSHSLPIHSQEKGLISIQWSWNKCMYRTALNSSLFNQALKALLTLFPCITPISPCLQSHPILLFITPKSLNSFIFNFTFLSIFFS